MVRDSDEFHLAFFGFAPPYAPWVRATWIRGSQQHAAAVGGDRAENQLENAIEQLIDVEDMARRLARLVHDRQIGQGAASQGEFLSGCNRMRLPSVSPIDLMIAEDSSTSARDDIDLLGQLADVRCRIVAAGAVDEHRLPDREMIARGERRLVDSVIVDKGAVDAADVDDFEAVGRAANLGVPARHFRVMQANGVRRVAADRGVRLGQIELLAFIGAFDHEQARHRSQGTRRVPARRAITERQVPPLHSLGLGLP